MTQKRKQKQQALRDRIADILWRHWDPIGLCAEGSECDDEYDAYVAHVVQLLVERHDEHKIAAYLTSAVRQNMGLSRNTREHDLRVAEQIVQAGKELLGP